MGMVEVQQNQRDLLIELGSKISEVFLNLSRGLNSFSVNSILSALFLLELCLLLYGYAHPKAYILPWHL